MTTGKILEGIQSLRSLINELCDLAGRLAAENAELRQQVAEQADALIELAEMCAVEEEETDNG